MSGTHDPSPKNRGLFLFLSIIAVMGAVAIIAYTITGPVDIEERFSSALGISPQADDTPGVHATAPGFSIEGQPFLYAVILAGLCGAGWLLYRRSGL